MNHSGGENGPSGWSLVREVMSRDEWINETRGESPSRDMPLEVLLLKISADENGEIAVVDLINKINHAGFLTYTDIRLKPLMDRILIKKSGSGADKYNIFNFKKTIDVVEMEGLPRDCSEIIKKTLLGKSLIPEFTRFSGDLRKLYDSVSAIRSGSIPAFLLGRSTDPGAWGVSVCTIDGQIWSHGDSKLPITLQSCSAALNYAIAITKLGTKYVHKFVGKEACANGQMSTLDMDKNGVPHNAMTQSGAMAITSLLLQETPNDLPSSYENIVNRYQNLAGNTALKINNTVYLADKSRSDRKFSIAFLLKECAGFPPDLKLKNIIDLYFQLNSVEVTCEIGAVMAGALANGGVCPTTGREVLSRTAVQNTLSIMHLQGMYSYSGEWMFHTGLPAKSSTSGMILLVVPGIMGMCLYSPRLDEHNNSARGLEFGRRVAQRYALHYLDNHTSAQSKEQVVAEGRESRELVIMNVMYAAAHGDINLLHQYYQQGVDLDVSDYDYRTALHLACCNDNIEIARFLIHKKVNVCALDRWNRSPLDDAKQYGSNVLVELLREHGAGEGPGVIVSEEEY